MQRAATAAAAALVSCLICSRMPLGLMLFMQLHLHARCCSRAAKSRGTIMHHRQPAAAGSNLPAMLMPVPPRAKSACGALHAPCPHGSSMAVTTVMATMMTMTADCQAGLMSLASSMVRAAAAAVVVVPAAAAEAGAAEAGAAAAAAGAAARVIPRLPRQEGKTAAGAVRVVAAAAAVAVVTSLQPGQKCLASSVHTSRHFTVTTSSLA